MKIGIVKETKIPIDRRVPLPPKQCKTLMEQFPDVEVVVQPSDIRAITDNEYIDRGIPMQAKLNDCDVLIGIKEVALDALIPNKIYIFFSHTAKKQPHNQKLLQEILKKNITLIDYEYLTNKEGTRVVAFGRYAGIVGAYNGLLGYGKRTKRFDLEPAHQCSSLEEMMNQLQYVKLPKDATLLVTGKGRVGGGAMEVLEKLNIKNVSSEQFLYENIDEPTLCQIDADQYVQRKDGEKFEFQHFFDHPEMYENIFKPYTIITDILFAGHFWNPKAPIFFTKDDAKQPDFRIKVIADISCDIPGPIPSTLRASTIAAPFYGYNPITEKEDDPFKEDCITVMAVDNLPCELPRDASKDFGETLVQKVLPSLIEDDTDNMIKNAMITENGKLTTRFQYLTEFAKQ